MKRVLFTFIVAALPVLYMATIETLVALFTLGAVFISILGSEFITSRNSFPILSRQNHQNLSRSVRALIERNLEAEIFNLSSKVEKRIESDLQEIDNCADSSRRRSDISLLLPIAIFFINAISIFFFVRANSTTLTPEKVLLLASMMVVAHLGAITSSGYRRN